MTTRINLKKKFITYVKEEKATYCGAGVSNSWYWRATASSRIRFCSNAPGLNYSIPSSAFNHSALQSPGNKPLISFRCVGAGIHLKQGSANLCSRATFGSLSHLMQLQVVFENKENLLKMFFLFLSVRLTFSLLTSK